MGWGWGGRLGNKNPGPRLCSHSSDIYTDHGTRFFILEKENWGGGRQTDRRTERHAGRQVDRKVDRQTDRQVGIQTDRQAGRQTDRQTDRQTETERKEGEGGGGREKIYKQGEKLARE